MYISTHVFLDNFFLFLICIIKNLSQGWPFSKFYFIFFRVSPHRPPPADFSDEMAPLPY